MLGAYLKTGQVQARYCDAMPMSCFPDEGSKSESDPVLVGGNDRHDVGHDVGSVPENRAGAGVILQRDADELLS